MRFWARLTVTSKLLSGDLRTVFDDVWFRRPPSGERFALVFFTVRGARNALGDSEFFRPTSLHRRLRCALDRSIGGGGGGGGGGVLVGAARLQSSLCSCIARRGVAARTAAAGGGAMARGTSGVGAWTHSSGAAAARQRAWLPFRCRPSLSAYVIEQWSEDRFFHNDALSATVKHAAASAASRCPSRSSSRAAAPRAPRGARTAAAATTTMTTVAAAAAAGAATTAAPPRPRRPHPRLLRRPLAARRRSAAALRTDVVEVEDCLAHLVVTVTRSAQKKRGDPYVLKTTTTLVPPQFAWPPIMLYPTMPAAPLRFPGAPGPLPPPPIVGGMQIRATPECPAAPKRSGERGKDTGARKQRRCINRTRNLGLDYATCKGRAAKMPCENFAAPATGTPRLTDGQKKKLIRDIVATREKMEDVASAGL